MAGMGGKSAKTSAAPVKKRKPIDWEAIERDKRTGKFTLRELETKYGVDNATIARKIKRDRLVNPDSWQEDLTEAVRQATNARLMQELVSNEISKGQQDVSTAVQAAAEVNANVIRQHQKDAGATRSLVMDMLAELTLATHKADELERLAEIVSEGQGADPDDIDEARRAVKDMLDIHKRVTSIQKLADTLHKLQPLERKAHGIKDDGDGDQPPMTGRPLATVPIEELRAALRGVT